MLLALMALPALGANGSDWKTWKYEDRGTIQRSFDVAAARRKLAVNNVIGFIHVTGYDGARMQIDVVKHIQARTPEALRDAKRDVKLDISRQGNEVSLYTDGPFRHDGDHERNYRVTFDFEIQAPRTTALDLHTIVSEIVVKRTSGDFDIHGLNGVIDMDEIAGSGRVRTLNGKVRVAFAHNPERDSEFHTLNGAIDVYFREPLNADLRFKTLNGGVYADFDVTPVTMHHSGSARAGKGGPELTFNGLNGAIRLHSKTI